MPRLGHVTQREAERWLENTIAHWRQGQAEQSAICNEYVFADGAAQYLKEIQLKPSADVIGFHVKLLLPFIGLLPLEQVHDATLEAFKEERLEGLDFGNGKPPKPVSPTTVNRSLEVVSTILNRAARAWRDEKGRPWLSVALNRPHFPRQLKSLKLWKLRRHHEQATTLHRRIQTGRRQASH